MLNQISQSSQEPSATLAVMHKYQAKGEASSTVMEVAAFDDVLCMVNDSLGIVVAEMMIMHRERALYTAVLSPLMHILGGVLVGVSWIGLEGIHVVAPLRHGAHHA